NGKPTEEVIEGNEIEIILDQTPFYPEGGGQVGDQGKFSSENSSIIEISDTQSPSSGIIVHQGKVSQGSIKVGDTVTAKVDISQREKSKRNHTGTHILHAALREILGKHVRQQGSLVAPERLRFDFTHLKKLTQKEIEEVQNLVNGKIRLNLPVHKHITSYNEAIESGALAFFGDKYDHEVRTVEISNGSKFSYELCGGTHCSFTGEIGAFYIISESSIASGVRRIEAVTGVNAENLVTKNFSILNKISSNLNVPTSELETKIDGITKEVENFKKELNNLQSKIYSINTQEFTKNSETIGKTTIVATLLDVPNQELLRQMGDNIRSQVDSGAICLASEIQGKASIIIMITKDISDKLNAKQLIQEISPIIQGGGGGRPELAQAGGIKPEKLPEAIKLFRKIVKTILSEN
ncbi:MAG: DHHA1 domain-containing protein, partial [Dehalococcoidia bacterium]|nr:DHHA1 domain-containing protein [Dehalococcoidia bacterium]